MRRFFGASKPQTPGPTLDEASKKVSTLANKVQVYLFCIG